MYNFCFVEHMCSAVRLYTLINKVIKIISIIHRCLFCYCYYFHYTLGTVIKHMIPAKQKTLMDYCTSIFTPQNINE